MNNNLLAIKRYTLGVITIGLLVGFISLMFYESNNNSKFNQYKVIFNNVDNLTINVPVTLLGYQVGCVKNIYLNKSYDPVLVLNINKNIKIRDDSSISVKEKDIMGHKILKLNLGISDNILSNGDTIYSSNSGISIINIIDMLIGYVANKVKGN